MHFRALFKLLFFCKSYLSIEIVVFSCSVLNEKLVDLFGYFVCSVVPLDVNHQRVTFAHLQVLDKKKNMLT